MVQKHTQTHYRVDVWLTGYCVLCLCKWQWARIFEVWPHPDFNRGNGKVFGLYMESMNLNNKLG